MAPFKIGSALIGSALWLLALVSAGTAFAHHSVQAEFDVNKEISLTGTVVSVEWINPHSYIHIDVKNANGKVDRWAFEMAGPGALRKGGLSRENRGGLKPGDTLTITGIPAKDGSTTGFVHELKFPDGRVFKIGGAANGN